MKVLPVLMIIIFGIGCKQKYSVSKESLINLYKAGWVSGHAACFKNIKASNFYGCDSVELLSPSYQEAFRIDSLEISQKLFK